ncbi:MAG TPA: DUF948 domain-containing protein [Thermoleophilia bacterium]|nr:DUF948 domain-containing protein [Thermoleophilia bacterium]
MESMVDVVAMSTASLVLRYAAAFFFVLVAVAAAYALIRAGKAMGRVEQVVTDVDKEALPLITKAGQTLDEVNTSLANVGEITKDVSQMTEKVDRMTSAVESAVTTPARKAAAFSAGVTEAVGTFFRRGDEGDQTR